MKLINLTPHAINVYLNDTNVVSIEPSGIIARCRQIEKVLKTIDVNGNEIDVVTMTYGDVYDLPMQQEGVGYIVSTLVASVVRGRTDIFIPCDQVRDHNGNIIGCRKLAVM